MKMIKAISLATALMIPLTSLTAGTIVATYEDVENFTDFSVSGLRETKTLKIFESELDSELERFARKYIDEGSTLEIVFTNIDMAGDIQPWRNRHNADIRYIERIYPPRLAFRYALKDADGTILDEGEASISDLAFDMSVIAPIRSQSMNFFYETNLLGDWIRKTMRAHKSANQGE